MRGRNLLGFYRWGLRRGAQQSWIHRRNFSRPPGTILHHFSEEVPNAYMASLLSQSSNPIYEIELLPLLAAVRLWGDWLRNRQAVFYLDNDAARAAMCKARGSTAHSKRIISEFTKFEEDLKIRLWFARVPTHSNLADAPSRGDTSYLQTQWGRLLTRWIGMLC